MRSRSQKKQIETCPNSEIARWSEVSGEVRDLAWQALGMAHLLKHTDTSAVPSIEVTYGIGRCLEKIGIRLEALAEDIELATDFVSKTKRRLENEK